MKMVIREKLVDNSDTVFVDRDVIDRIQKEIGNESSIHLTEDVILSALTLAWWWFPGRRIQLITVKHTTLIMAAISGIRGILKLFGARDESEF